MKAIPDPLLSLRDWTLVRNVPDGEITLLEGIDLDIRPGRWLAVLVPCLGESFQPFGKLVPDSVGRIEADPAIFRQ